MVHLKNNCLFFCKLDDTLPTPNEFGLVENNCESGMSSVNLQITIILTAWLFYCS